MSLRTMWLYPLLIVLWLGILLWLWQEQQQQYRRTRDSIRAQGQVIIETVAGSIRAHSRMAMNHPHRLRVILEEVISPSGVLAIALFDSRGKIIALAGDETKLDYSLFPGTTESWGATSLQLWSGVRIGKFRWPGSLQQKKQIERRLRQMKHAWRRRQQLRRMKMKMKEMRRRRRFQPNSRFFLTIALSFQGIQEFHSTGTRLRWTVAAMSFVLLTGLAALWNSSLRRIEFRNSLELAEKQNQHLREMNLAANGLAHETKNPLNTLRMTAQTLLDVSPDSSEWRRGLDLIADEVDRLGARINGWLAFSRPKEPVVKPVSLSELFAELEKLVSFDTDEKQATMTLKHGGLVVWADREMLRQMLFNLLLNGVQALESGGYIEMHIDEKPHHVAIVVVDDGVGVPPRDRERLFSPYFTTRDNGSGLGLAICRQIAFAHGWDLYYEPGMPRGSRFIIDRIAVAKR